MRAKVAVLCVSMLAASCEPRPGRVAPAPPGVAPVSSAVGGDERAGGGAPVVSRAELEGDFACGPFSTAKLASPQPLLNGRIQVRFLEGVVSGAATVGKVEATAGQLKAFVGARETFLHSDAGFERAASVTARFDGGYDPVTILGEDEKLRIVAGVYRDAKQEGEMVALAHGWLADAHGDVVDVAVFVSRGAVQELAPCRRFAEKILSTVSTGPRALDRPSDRLVTTKVSFAAFQYNPSAAWTLLNADGIDDFAHMRLTKRGVFPDGGAELALGLDSAPGDWSSPGRSDGDRPGRLLGSTIQWHLTRHEHGYGAWAVGAESKRERPVARIIAGSERARDEAIAFAESVTVR